MATRTRTDPVSRGHHIPLRRQLAAQFEASIRDRHLEPGERLPSSRDLARRAGVDRGTVGAVYARLRRRGLIESGPGRVCRIARSAGVVTVSEHVGGSDGGDGAALVEAAIHALLENGLRAGLPREMLLLEAEGQIRRKVTRPPSVWLAEPRPRLRTLLELELRSYGIDVASVRHPSHVPKDCPITLRHEVMGRWPRGRGETIPLFLAGGTRERGVIRRRVRRGLVVLLSRSRAVRTFAAELAAGCFADGVSFRALDPYVRPAEAVRAIDAARHVFYDRLCSSYAAPAGGAASPIRLVQPARIAALERYLGPNTAPTSRRSSQRLGT